MRETRGSDGIPPVVQKCMPLRCPFFHIIVYTLPFIFLSFRLLGNMLNFFIFPNLEISLTQTTIARFPWPVISEVFETIIPNQLPSFFEHEGLLGERQYGVRPCRSTGCPSFRLPFLVNRIR